MNKVFLFIILSVIVYTGCRNNSHMKSTDIKEIVSHLNKTNFVDKYRGFRAEPRDSHNHYMISCDSLDNNNFVFLYKPNSNTILVGGYNSERFEKYFKSRYPTSYKNEQREYIRKCDELLDFMNKNNIAIIDGKFNETGIGNFQVLLYSNWDLIYKHDKKYLSKKSYTSHFDSIYWVDSNWVAMKSRTKTEYY